MFWNRSKAREPDGMLSLAYSPYSLLKPIGYQIPEDMLEEIEKEAERVTRDSISHSLIDELTPEEMQNDNPAKMHFLKKYIHHCFAKPLTELKRQKIVIDREGIGAIRMLQKADLTRHKRSLDFARAELRQCEFILGTGNNSKAHIYNKMIGGKSYE